jgi:hypothetical protein
MKQRRRELDEEEKLMPDRLLETCGYKTPHTSNRKKNDSTNNNNITITLEKGVITRQTNIKNKYIFIKQL